MTRLDKFQFTIIMFLIPLLFGWLLLSDYSLSREKYKIAALTIVLVMPICLHTIGSRCEVKTNADGLYVEFFWKFLFVPWEEIKGVKYIGLRPFGYWIVLTNKSITIFHRLYSIGTFPLLHSFQIHKDLEARDVLLSMIKNKL